MLNTYSNITRNSKIPSVINLQAMCDAKTLMILREDLIGEIHAISQYDLHINELTNEFAKSVLRSIRDEERVHMGELLAVIDVLCPEEAQLKNKGKEEVMALLGQTKNS